MSVIHLRHITTALEATYSALIDMADYAERPEGEARHAFLQRSLAAYALESLALVDPAAAADGVVDGFGDNGIDAVLYEQVEKTVYVVQAKWDSAGTSAPEAGDVQKFVQGFRDLINTRFDRFNPKLRAKQTTLTAALDDTQAKFKLVLVHSGTQTLSEHARRPLADLVDDLNDTTEIVSYQVLRQSDVHALVAGQAEGVGVSFDVALHDWGSVQEPHIAYYGQIEAEDLAAWWSEHGTRLLAKNLRKFIGDSEVNNSIVDTLLADPENFWYFNNGVTVLCTSLEKKPIGGSDRRSGQFRCEGISIVNGAQTVGCIGTALLKSPEQVAKARVMVRFISLADCPPEFASEVTRATNTQNRIERRDFVSLDKEQERLQTELRLEGHQYALKTGDVDPLPESGCSVTEATVALACALADSGLAVQAKREIGRLWENIERPPYKLIFNGSVSGFKLWRCVEVLRTVEGELKAIQDQKEGKTRSIAVHGNRLILHAVMQRLPVTEFSEPQHDTEASRAQTIILTHQVFDSMANEVDKQFPISYVASLFKNATKCKALVEAIA